MKKNWLKTALTVVFSVLIVSSVVYAATIRDITGFLGGSPGDEFIIDGTLKAGSLKIGAQGAGGVTFFNGTIVNNTTTSGADNPVTFGDNVRIDGRLYRGARAGTSDALPLIVNDNVEIAGSLTVGSTNVLDAISSYMLRSTYDVGANSMVDADKIDSGLAATLVGAGSVDNTEFGHIDGVSSNVQTQLNGKLTSSSTIAATQIGTGTISNTEFGYLNGVTSAIQTQLNAKGVGDMLKSTYDVAGNSKIDAGKIDSGLAATLIGTGTISNTEFGYLNSVTSNIQTQLSGKLTSESDPQVGSVTTSYVPRWNGSALVTGTIYDNATNVGIGTADPSNTFQVADYINFDNTSNMHLTALGYQAGNAILSSGIDNTFVGYLAGNAVTTGDYNTAFGYNALGATITTSNNTAIGYGALDANTDTDNTAVGYNALGANTTGTETTAVGSGALDASTDGERNVAFGYNALGANDSADDNVAIGHSAMAAANTTGNRNTAVGNYALDANTNGVWSTAVGYGALGNGTGLDGNTAVGYLALSLTTGDNNIGIGYQAGDNITSGASNIIIGYDVNAASATGSNQLNIGDAIIGNLSTGNITHNETKTVTDDTDGKTLTINESGSVQTNAGAGGGAIWNLPEASTAVGMYFTFATAAAQNFDINPDNADQILILTNAAGDAVRNATVGNTITLLAIDSTNWVEISSVGTWTDAN